MRDWAKRAGIIFLAAASVYSFGAATAGGQSVAAAGNGAKAASADSAAVKVLEEASSNGAADPFSNNSNTANTNSTATTQPSKDGQSVSANQVNVSEAGNVEIHVNDANLVEVLRMLSLQSQKNIIASKEVRGTVTANLYDVTVREALDAILHANGYAYREKGNFIYVYTTKEIAEIEKSEKKATTEVFRLFYTPAANVLTLIKPALSADGQASATTPAVTGMESSAKNTGGDAHATQDAIVVTDYPDNLDRVRRLLKEIDRRPQQILIEATILRAALSEDNSLGVDFNFLGGVDFGSITQTAGQVLSGDIGNPNTGSSGGSGGSTSGTAQPQVLNASHANSTGTGTNFTQGINGFRVGVVTNSLSVFVAALEQVTDTTVMANPKVLALNKQSGEVIVGREDGYLTSTVTQTSTVQTVDFLKTGTRLIFRPFIGDDGYIRMEIHPEDSSGGLNGANLPFKITTEVTSNVMVKDGHTIVIGGLFREESTVGKSQIPFFGNIPLAGYLFRKQADHTQREEIIVLLTPHIIKDDKAYSDASEKELKEGEKLRVGVRNGMMVGGRERLAECEYEKAVEEMKKPNPDRKSALWHLDCATNLNPTFREAIELKEEISGKEITSADNSSIRDFVKRQIMADQANGVTTPELPHSVPLSEDHSSRDVRPMSTTLPADTNETPSQAKSSDSTTTPATQDVATETPATSQPATQGETAEVPASQPAAAQGQTAEVPATQNVAETPTTTTPAAQTVTEIPATQNVAETPATNQQDSTKTQAAASQPAQDEATASSAPNATTNSDSNSTSASASASTTEPSNEATASSNDTTATGTQPSAKNETKDQQQQQQNQAQSQQQPQQKSTVTELPTEEINSNSSPSNAADSNSNENSK